MSESFSPETALQYLQQLGGQPASVDSLTLLAGNVARAVQDLLWQSEDVASGIALAYLQAAAQHLYGVSAAGNTDRDSSGSNKLGEILSTIGRCVTKCSPRSSISETGILPILLNLTANDDDILTPAHNEFLQACIFAEQYNYAERHIIATWPRPNSKSGRSVKSVQQVLRHYYLRGVVHMGCRNWAMAVRSFWTCLSIPGSDQNVVSAVAIAAWKKLVLVQCCQADFLETSVPQQPFQSQAASSGHFGPSTPQNLQPKKGPLSTPKEMSGGMTRYLNTAQVSGGGISSGGAAKSSSPMAPPAAAGGSGLGAAAPLAPEDHPDAMHMVEVEGESEEANETDERQNDRMQVAGGGGDSGSAVVAPPNKGVGVYQELVKAFIAVDRASFSTIMNEHAKLFQDDGNMGMVRQAEAVLLHRQVYLISSMYSVIAQEEMATYLGLSNVEQLQTLLTQVSTKKAWPIELENGLVIFPRLPPSCEKEDDTVITSTTSELIGLSRMIQLRDISLGLSSKYPTGVRPEIFAALQGEKGSRGVEDV